MLLADFAGVFLCVSSDSRFEIQNLRATCRSEGGGLGLRCGSFSPKPELHPQLLHGCCGKERAVELVHASAAIIGIYTRPKQPLRTEKPGYPLSG